MNVFSGRDSSVGRSAPYRLLGLSLAVIALLATACGSGGGSSSAKPTPAGPGTIGLALPTTSPARWITDGKDLVAQFTSLGYRTDLRYADNDAGTQVSQLQSMIHAGDKALVVGAVDSTSLGDVLGEASRLGIAVIAYDRLIRETSAVNYYATFDNFNVGVLQGSYIAEKLGLKAGKGPFTIELFAGSSDDNNSYFFFNGAMSVLEPYLRSGKLVVRSGQVAVKYALTPKWDPARAQSRLSGLLRSAYANQRLDAVLAPNDGIGLALVGTLTDAGYGTSTMPMPIVTGQDADLTSVKSIIANGQSQTVYKDFRQLAKITAEIADAELKGRTPPVNDTKSYDNGVEIVPSYLIKPVSVDRSNYESVLVKSAFYSAAQVGG